MNLSDEMNFMGKRMVYFCIAVLLLSLGLTAVPRTFSQTQNIKVVKYGWYIDSYGLLDVVGLVQNVGPNTISAVALAGSVVGPNDVDIADSGAPVWVSYLLPNQEAPFYMEFYAPQSSSAGSSTTWYEIAQAGAIHSIAFRVSSANATTSYQYQGLKITSQKGSIGTTGGYKGAYVVNGVIKNTGDQPATNLTVVGAFFNSTGSVVGVGYTDYLTPTVLGPGSTATFQIAAFDLNQSLVGTALQIKSFQLLVQTKEPILQGTTPIVSPQETGTTGPTDSPSSSSSSHAKANLSILLPIIVAIVIAVIILVALVAVVRQVLDRNARRSQTVKEARKTQKQKPK